MLKIDDFTWCREDNEFKQYATEFYHLLYNTMGMRDFDPVLEQWPRIIQEVTNEDLLALITMEEVMKVIFQIALTKAPGPNGLNGHFY